VRPKLHAPPEAGHGPPADRERGEGRDDLIIESDPRIEPAEPRHPPWFGIAGVGEDLFTNLDGEPHAGRGQVPGPDDHLAAILPGRISAGTA